MRKELLNVAGMTCGGCAGKVMRALQAVNGVKDVRVSAREGKAAVQFEESLTSPEQLEAAVRQAGYGLEPAGDARPASCKDCNCCG